MDMSSLRREVGASAERLPVAVIGGGFSGTISALNLMRTLPPDQTVLLCERAQKFACGVAYATEQNDHLLNVRAANMSAFAEQPDSFECWVRGCASEDTRRVRHTPEGVFASRSLYGRYLNAMLDMAMAGCAGSARLRLVAEAVIDVAPTPGGWLLVFAGGAVQRVGAVVLAIGNVRSSPCDSEIYRSDAWAPGALEDLHGDLPVLVVGTGLTTMDLAVSLRAAAAPPRALRALAAATIHSGRTRLAARAAAPRPPRAGGRTRAGRGLARCHRQPAPRDSGTVARLAGARPRPLSAPRASVLGRASPPPGAAGGRPDRADAGERLSDGVARAAARHRARGGLRLRPGAASRPGGARAHRGAAGDQRDRRGVRLAL
jgi:hypothetical protein